MCPEPVYKIKDAAPFYSSEDSLKDRPELAAMIMRVIGLWSTTDTLLSDILCELMKSDIMIGAATFSVINSPRNREEMLRKAARIALKKDKESRDLLECVLKKLPAKRRVRDKFAHSLWGIPNREDAIIRLDPSYVAKRHAGHKAWRKVFDAATTQEEIKAIDSHDYAVDYDGEYYAMYYTAKDLRREIRDARWAFTLVNILKECLDESCAPEERERCRSDLNLELAKQG